MRALAAKPEVGNDFRLFIFFGNCRGSGAEVGIRKRVRVMEARTACAESGRAAAHIDKSGEVSACVGLKSARRKDTARYEGLAQAVYGDMR